jgi:hypothetical protein
MELKEIRYEEEDCIHLADSCEHGNEPAGSMKGG